MVPATAYRVNDGLGEELALFLSEIGRASCRERVSIDV